MREKLQRHLDIKSNQIDARNETLVPVIPMFEDKRFLRKVPAEISISFELCLTVMLSFVFFNCIIVLSCLVLYGSSSCSELNNCNGHGICSINDKCVCFEGWGASTDVTMYRAPDCSAKVCPSGISWGSGPRRDGEAHLVTECSDKGICDRKTGKCKCPAGFEGAACQRLKCPNDCSGHGSCVTMERLATKDVGFPLIDYPVTYESGNVRTVLYSMVMIKCHHSLFCVQYVYI